MPEGGSGRAAAGEPAAILRFLAIGLALLMIVLTLIGVSRLAIGTAACLLALVIWVGWRPFAAPAAEERPLEVRGAQAGPELQAVLDALASPTILIDRRGIVLHANQAAYAAFPGFRQGYPVSSALRAPEVLAMIDSLQSGRQEGQARLIERVPVERSFEISVRRLSQAAAMPPIRQGAAFAVIHMAETTEAMRIEAMRVDFVANASHELRTPLASILGFVETLQGPARNDEKARQHFLDIMATQARRMARLIDDLLSLSRIEMREHIRPLGEVDLALLLPELIDALTGLASERQVEVRLTIAEGMDGRVKGDRDELLRLFENLIENAIKYGATGKYVDIRLEPAPETAGVTVSVRDYGPGIAAEHLPRLTERFYRADIAESRILGGTGLGLAIVKHIVTRHRGRLSIDSRPGTGAVFTILLPER